MREGKTEQMEIASDDFIVKRKLLEHLLEHWIILREDYEKKLEEALEEYNKRLATILSRNE